MVRFISNQTPCPAQIFVQPVLYITVVKLSLPAAGRGSLCYAQYTDDFVMINLRLRLSEKQKSLYGCVKVSRHLHPMKYSPYSLSNKSKAQIFLKNTAWQIKIRLVVSAPQDQEQYRSGWANLTSMIYEGHLSMFLKGRSSQNRLLPSILVKTGSN